jgi:hypothetical protein
MQNIINVYEHLCGSALNEIYEMEKMWVMRFCAFVQIQRKFICDNILVFYDFKEFNEIIEIVCWYNWPAKSFFFLAVTGKKIFIPSQENWSY